MSTADLIDPNWRGAGVYRLYDTTGRLLYIGKASNGPAARVRAHRRRRWGRRIARVHWTPCLSEALALDVEARAIRLEAPRYNRQHNRGRGFDDHRLPPATPLNPVEFPVWLARAATLGLLVGATLAVVFLW